MSNHVVVTYAGGLRRMSALGKRETFPTFSVDDNSFGWCSPFTFWLVIVLQPTLRHVQHHELHGSTHCCVRRLVACSGLLIQLAARRLLLNRTTAQVLCDF